MVHLDRARRRGPLDIEDLLGHYAEELRASDQDSEADRIVGLAADATRELPEIVPDKVQADPSISTE